MPAPPMPSISTTTPIIRSRRARRLCDETGTGVLSFMDILKIVPATRSTLLRPLYLFLGSGGDADGLARPSGQFLRLFQHVRWHFVIRHRHHFSLGLVGERTHAACRVIRL